MLNESLKLELIVQLNGKMLASTTIFAQFDIIFLSELTFLLKRETFSIDDNIFDEGDKGNSVVFVTKGSVILLHKKSRTYIKELEVDEFMGDYAFFSDQRRKATARAKSFSEVLKLDKHDFLENIISFPVSA
jgi:CRP-like cAMP-binding protein